MTDYDRDVEIATLRRDLDAARADKAIWRRHAEELAGRVDAAGAIRVELDQKLGQPTEAKIWRDGALIFDGVSRDALLHRQATP